MKVTVPVMTEIDIQTVRLECPFRYIGDSDDDDLPSDFPLLKNGIWIAEVDVETGRINNWPERREEMLFAKICDEGTYKLIDSNGEVVSTLQDYVPDLIPNEFGDYVTLTINKEGIIENWPKKHSFNEFFNLNNEEW